MKKMLIAVFLGSGVFMSCEENLADYGTPKLSVLSSDTLVSLVGAKPAVSLNVSAGNGAKYVSVFRDGDLKDRVDVSADATTFMYEGNVENDTTFFTFGFILTNLNGTNSSLVTVPVKITAP